MEPIPRLLVNESSRKTVLDVALEAVNVAGNILRERFQTALQVDQKGPRDIVTDVDHQVESEMLGLLCSEFPDFGVVAEESPHIQGNSPYTWVVDPLDGTRNFAAGIPHFATVVALMDGDEALLGITYDPLKEELFLAERGKGAMLNGKPIRVSTKLELKACLLGLDLGYVADTGVPVALEMLRHIWPSMQSVRLMGSAALGLAYAAAGRLDVYFHHRLSPWDMAAGSVQVVEAGGVLTDRYGGPFSLQAEGVIATNTTLHNGFLNAIRDVAGQR